MYKSLILAIAILSNIGCSEEHITPINIPDDIEIDLDNDGNVDFEIIYEQLSVVAPIDPDPGSFELIRGKLLSKNNNQTLKNENINSLLFLDDINLIQPDNAPPLIWEENINENSSLIISISQNMFDKTWAEEWTINKEEIKNSYLVGFKLSNSSNSLGFMELSIETQTGMIEILNVVFI